MHVVGAGLAGLSAAVALATRNVAVELIEASSQAGGRCRAFHDPVLDMTIDNGNHLVLSGNQATHAYLDTIGARHALIGPDQAFLDFHDLRDDLRWRLKPNLGPLAWWILAAKRRVPGTRARDYLALAALMATKGEKRIDQAITCQGVLWDRLVEPFLLAALNSEVASGSAALAGAVIRQSLARGGAAYRPRIAHPNLSAAFVNPALVFLRARGASLRFGEPVRGLSFEGERVSALAVAGGQIPVAEHDSVILATPPWVNQALIPSLTVPTAFNAIVNAHFRIAAPPLAPMIVGVIGGAAQWIFAFPDRISVTVSAANAMVDTDREALARTLWRDVAAVHALAPDLPPWRIIKERRATFAATPQQNALRPGARTRWRNLALAGDWTDTGLPATIEGAVRSGNLAAAMLG